MLQLCDSKYFDLPTDIEISMRQNYLEFQKLVDESGGLSTGPSAQAGTNLELINRLQTHISAYEGNHLNLMQALLFAILTAPQLQARLQAPDAHTRLQLLQSHKM